MRERAGKSLTETLYMAAVVDQFNILSLSSFYGTAQPTDLPTGRVRTGKS